MFNETGEYSQELTYGCRVREKGGVPWDWADETVCDCWVVWGHVVIK